MSRSAKVEQEAASWILRREEAGWSEEDEAALEHWLAQSDFHKATFWRLEKGWSDADRIAAVGAVVPPRREMRPALGWWGAGLAAAASLALVFAIVPLKDARLPFSTDEKASAVAFETKVGGHKKISFSDGTRVELNTATLLRASISGKARTVWLDRGEAFFEVAKRAGESFVIDAGPNSVMVVGTKFSVRRNGTSLNVAVVDGRVQVASDSGQNLVIGPGEMAVAEGGTIAVDTNAMASVQRDLAWRKGMLIFDDSTLSEAAAEFNRYNRKQLVILDDRNRRIRIGGNFRATNVDGFARLLREAYGLNVRVDGETISVSS